MSEAAAPVPTPTQHPNAPQNDKPPEVAKSVETPDYKAKAEKLERDYAAKLRDHISQRRKWESQQAELQPRLARLSELEKREARAKSNPAGFLQDTYGEKWKDILSEAAVHGVTPAALIEEKVAAIQADFEAKLKARDEADAKQRESAQTQQVEQARKSLFAEAASFYRDAGKDYPVLAELGSDVAVARMMAQEIEATFHKTHEVDAEGNVVKQGRVMTPKEAAEAIEERVLGITSKALGHEKYKSKLQPKTDSATVSATSKQQGQTQSSTTQTVPPRRSLSNDITASTTTVRAPANDAERRERAIKAMEAARKQG